MSESLSTLGLVLTALAVVIWGLTEVVSRLLTSTGLKSARWAKALLHLLPILLGVVICGTPGSLAWLMELFGYVPKHPPGVGASMLMGAFSGAGAVLCHDKIGAFVGRKVRATTKEDGTSSGGAPHGGA
jgi:hypothetical protein